MTTVGVTRDAAAMAALHATSFPDAWSGLFFGALLAQPGVFALTAPEGAADAFILIRIVMDEAEILTLAVRPEQRQRGHGRALMAAAMELMKEHNVERCFLEVSVDNAAAIALYTRAGFVTCGRRRDYYQHGSEQIDAIMMERRLRPV